MDDAGHVNTRTHRARRCVVWHRAGVSSSGALIRALASRGLRVETSCSGHEVLAIGCREQKKVGEGHVGVIVVLDGGGGELVDQQRVLGALERFCPQSRVWVYEEGANPPLRGFVDEGEVVDAPKSAVEVQVRVHETVQEQVKPESTSQTSLRIAGNNGRHSALKASDVLDQDELAALLRPNDLD